MLHLKVVPRTVSYDPPDVKHLLLLPLLKGLDIHKLGRLIRRVGHPLGVNLREELHFRALVCEESRASIETHHLLGLPTQLALCELLRIANSACSHVMFIRYL